MGEIIAMQKKLQAEERKAAEGNQNLEKFLWERFGHVPQTPGLESYMYT